MANGRIVISASSRPKGAHPRVYNDQSNLKELRIVTNEQPGSNDLVVQRQGGGLKIISDKNSTAMPLQFTLFSPLGTHGWNLELRQANGLKRVTPREFFAFHLNKRISEYFLFQAGRLFQEWILMGWITCENQKLAYLNHNQGALRADTYRNVQDHIRRLNDPASDSLYHNEHENSSGRKILPSSFIGSPRWYNSKFQDGMAIVRHFGKPTLFITMTTNPNWLEIKEGLSLGQYPQDRPDLVARVFKLKKDQLLNDIFKGSIFGTVVAYLWVIEFQKRGLPHIHILIILSKEHAPETANDIDEIICAELPPDPLEPEITAEQSMNRKPLWDAVTSHMIHGPCGILNQKCVCMEGGKCTKRFPKPLIDRTSVDESNSHPIYRRRSPQDGGRTFQKNQHV